MRLRPWMILAALGCCIVAWRALALLDEVGRARAAEARAREAEMLSARIAALRLQQPTAGLGERPKEDLISVVQAVAARASIPASAVRDVAPAGERGGGAGGGGGSDGVVRQSATVTLEPLSPAELGVFLAAWARDQRIWSVERFSLTPMRSTPPQTTRYRVQLSVEAQYLQAARSERAAP